MLFASDGGEPYRLDISISNKKMNMLQKKCCKTVKALNDTFCSSDCKHEAGLHTPTVDYVNRVCQNILH